MTNQEPPKALISLSSLLLIPIVASFLLIGANRVTAEEILRPGTQVYAEQRVYAAQDPAQQAQSRQQAESDPSRPSERQESWKFTLGAGIMVMPAFLGSKDYQAVAFPNFKVEYKDRFFASLFEGIGYKVINNDKWSAGPIVKFDFGRTEDDDNPFRIAGDKTNALRGLGDVDATVELGGFVEYGMGPLVYQLELRQGVGGHQGLVVETGLNLRGFIGLSGKTIMYSFGPRATFADANYINAYFGIDQTQSANSGLARYDADAGLVSYGIGGFAVVPITDSVSLGVFGGYDRLAGEVADSPLIKERGDENQFMGGIRITYEFGY